jgi:putative transcriptional regulator
MRHFPDDVVRGFAIGTASEGAQLAVACHLSFCGHCRDSAWTHELMLAALLQLSLQSGMLPPPAARDRLLASLPPLPPPVRRLSLPAFPGDLPELPQTLCRQLESLPRVSWQRLIPGIRAIDLQVGGAYRCRLVSFMPGIPIPAHDHGGPEHTVVFSGGLDDEDGHLGRGDACTMMPGHAHRQRSSPGEHCVALIVHEAAPRPLGLMGRVLKRLTNS